MDSRALQETLYLMGNARQRRWTWSICSPNKHHFLVDLEPFGLSNDGEVFDCRRPAIRADRGRPWRATMLPTG